MINFNILTPIEVNDMLSIKGLTSNLTDEQLDTLIDSTILEIESITGININPFEREDVFFDFHGDTYSTSYYPIFDIINVTLDGDIVSCEDYNLDTTNGIIRFKSPVQEPCVLRVNYLNKLTDECILTIVKPLLLDMLICELDPNMENRANSMSEGDVSINFDTANNLQNKINNRLTQLKNKAAHVQII